MTRFPSLSHLPGGLGGFLGKRKVHRDSAAPALLRPSGAAVVGGESEISWITLKVN